MQDLYRPDHEPPVLVGGGAVELFTGGAYITGDLDFAGTVPASVSKTLTDTGFSRQGRYWIHETGRIFMEFPSAALADKEISRNLAYGDCNILIVSPEDLIVDRLSAWKNWRSAVDGVNAFLVYSSLIDEFDMNRLNTRSAEEDVSKAFNALEDLYAEFGGKLPDAEVMEAWAKRIP